MSQSVNPIVTHDTERWAYADLADLTVNAAVVASVRIREAIRLKGAQAAGVPQGMVRFYVEADVTALIRGDGGMPPRINYVVDAPFDSRGRAPKLAKAQFLVLGRKVPGRPASIQLVAPDAQLRWTPELEARARAIATEAARPDAPPAVVRIGNAFHVAGTLPGEGETQIFVIAEGDRPISLSVLRRPGQQRQWAVSLGEIVDESAGIPARDTLLWYRLACGLPRALPERALNDAGPADSAAAREDYRFVIEQLGPCGRTRGVAG